VIGNDGGVKEKVQNSGGRSFQRQGPATNMRREVTGVRERLRQCDDLVERVCWMVKIRKGK